MSLGTASAACRRFFKELVGTGGTGNEQRQPSGTISIDRRWGLTDRTELRHYYHRQSMGA
jgi:hypothetical protein